MIIPVTTKPIYTSWVASKKASRKYKLTSESAPWDCNTSTTIFTLGSSDLSWAGAFSTLLLSAPLKIAANTAAPILCPKYLENIFVPVTTPHWPHATVDCTPTNKGVDIKPKPAPNVI